jgi:hypothetical protein
MIKYCIFIWVGIIGSFTLQAQELLPIQLDRPDQTETPMIVPKGYIQFESGFSYEKTDANNKIFNYPSVLWKYGVNSKFELRLITELVSTKSGSEKYTGITPIVIGFKANLLEEKGMIPQTSFIGHLATAGLASKNYKTTFYAPSFRFLMQHTLSDKFSLSYNLGSEWDGESPEPIFIYTFTGGATITKRLGCYAELYGFVPQKQMANHSADGGFTYLVTNNFMLDLSGGVGLTRNAPSYFIAFGISGRFKAKRS